MKKQKRIALTHGSARVDEDCSQETIDMLNKLADAAYNMDFSKVKKPLKKSDVTRTPNPNLPTHF
jgi:hypothetical protein